MKTASSVANGIGILGGARPGDQVRAYIAAQPPRARKALRALRDAIRSVAPGAREHFSYRMPAFRLEDRQNVWYAAYKEHTSLYPFGEVFVRAHAPGLAPNVASKGTIRFPLDQHIPVAQVKRLIKAQVTELKKKAKR